MGGGENGSPDERRCEGWCPIEEVKVAARAGVLTGSGSKRI